EHLRRSRVEPPTLTLVSEIRESETVRLTEEFRGYFARLGGAIGEAETGVGQTHGVFDGHLRKTVRVQPPAARALRAEALDVVTERLDEAPSYFDDAELMLAMSNVAAMLAPGGVFLHNEARPMIQSVASALGLPFEQSRQAIIATVRGAAAPLGDSVWLHRKTQSR
ncbi:MAG: hypothetical protein DMF91_16575, partial [Acidobacteria bacterium]